MSDQVAYYIKTSGFGKTIRGVRRFLEGKPDIVILSNKNDVNFKFKFNGNNGVVEFIPNSLASYGATMGFLVKVTGSDGSIISPKIHMKTTHRFWYNQVSWPNLAEEYDIDLGASFIAHRGYDLYVNYRNKTLTLASKSTESNYDESVLVIGLAKQAEKEFLYSLSTPTIVNKGNRDNEIMYLSPQLFIYDKFFMDAGTLWSNIDPSAFRVDRTVLVPTGDPKEPFKEEIASWFGTSNWLPAQCSINVDYPFFEGDGRYLPTYTNINFPSSNNSMNESGLSVNELNEVALILPCYFFIKHTPRVLDTWSCLGRTDEIGYVNMYNIGNEHIAQSNYPVVSDKYICFGVWSRRNTSKMEVTTETRRKINFYNGSYLGIAVRLMERTAETEDDVSVVPSIQ